MLSQGLSRLRGMKRKGEEERGRMGDAYTRGLSLVTRISSSLLPLSPSPLLPFLAIALTILSSCGSKPTDPRTVIPADALVYLESNDLGATLSAITENSKFQQLAKGKPDLSPLSGVKVSIAVVGFAASEQAVDEENSVLNFQSKLVAVAETNAWGWQTRSFIEDKLGEVVNEFFEGSIELEVTTRKDGEYYVWTAQDGRKAYALQQGSLIFFGNDEAAIERCLAVKRGEEDSIAKNSKIISEGNLAFAYVSPDGVGQISNLIGLQLAKSTGEEADVQSFVARVLPEILRNSVKEVTWSAIKSGDGVEDKYVISLDDEAARVFNETIVPAPDQDPELAKFVPATALSATRYLLKDSQIAWRSIVLTSQKKTDQASGALIAAFSGSVFEPYGIEEPEPFLSAVRNQLITVRIGPDSEDVAVIASVKDPVNLRKGIAKEIGFSAPASKEFGADVWKSEDGELAAAIVGEIIVVGNAEVVAKCLEARQASNNLNTQAFSSSDAVATTIGNEEASWKLAEAFSERKNNEPVMLAYRTETRFNKNGIERHTTSDFGLIGALIERLIPD